MDPKGYAEQVFFLPLRVEAQDMLGNSSVGTAFYYSQPVAESKNRKALLVTCKHVLFGKDGLVTLRLHKKSPEKLAPLFGQSITIGPLRCCDVYQEHDNPDVDVAVINISSLIDDCGAYCMAINTKHFLDFSNCILSALTPVSFVGYPVGLYDSTNNLPILRTGSIASAPKVDFQGRPEFLIDAQVYPGSSGSPVFADTGDKFQFIGMLGKSMIRDAEVRQVAKTGYCVDDHIGLGVVYKPQAILDVVNKF